MSGRGDRNAEWSGRVTVRAPRSRLGRAVAGEGTTLVDAIAAVLREGPPMRFGLVFGSAARGTTHPGSDVDVGIVPADDALPLHEELALQARLERACGRPVDLVRLDRASTLLKWKAVREGVPVAVRSAVDLKRFTVAAALEYVDMAPNLHAAERRFQARVAAGHGGGAA
jgi:predicted nucleotidyltransferase